MSHALWPWEVHHLWHKDGGRVAIFHQPGKKTAEIFRIHFPPGIGYRALEISRLIEEAPEMLAELRRSAETFGKMAGTLSLLSHNTAALAMDIAKVYNHEEKVIARAEGKDGAE